METSLVDVLVIGAGPAGLMCATGLSRAGFKVRVVDKRPQKVMVGHADGIQMRSLEVLESYGLLHTLEPRCARVYLEAHYRPGPEGGIQLDSQELVNHDRPGRFPYKLLTHQGNIEDVYIESLATFNVKVERPVFPVSIEVSDDSVKLPNSNAHPVKVVLQRGDGSEESVHAKYVLGCDGARSWVRNAVGLPIDGDETDFVWGVVDLVPETDFPHIRARTTIESPSGSALILPREDEKVRFYVQLDPHREFFDESGRFDLGKVSADKIIELVTGYLKPYTLKMRGSPEWWSAYRIRQQVARQFHVDRRVFIAGDACHTHSPKGGQGLNASINDGHNLIWKLTYALRGWAKPSLLDTYESERRGFAQDLINADKVVMALNSKRWKSEEERAVLLQKLGEFSGYGSGIGIHYEPSTVIDNAHQSLASKAIVGERFPLGHVVCAADGWSYHIHDLMTPADLRFKLIVLAGDLRIDGQITRLRELASMLASPFWAATDGIGKARPVEVIAVAYGREMTDVHSELPAALGLHWEKTFVDAREAATFDAGSSELHAALGVGPQGAVILARPDGYVATVAPLGAEAEPHLTRYFSGFLGDTALKSGMKL